MLGVLFVSIHIVLHFYCNTTFSDENVNLVCTVKIFNEHVIYHSSLSINYLLRSGDGKYGPPFVSKVLLLPSFSFSGARVQIQRLTNKC
jgi:hypothetical protein